HFFNNFKEIKQVTEIFSKLEELKNTYPNSNSLWEFLSIIFDTLNKEDDLEPFLRVDLPNLHDALTNDLLGTMLQGSLNFTERKTLAANYTTPVSSEILVSLLDIHTPSFIVDPFCGSGRLISAYLESLDKDKPFPRIRINDIMPSAVLIAFCRLILLLSKYNQDYNLLTASVGDAFTLFHSKNSKNTDESGVFDLILMNPPFTRTHRINNEIKENLHVLERKYNEFLTGQVGLHVYAIFLADMILKNDGVLATVLPAATVLSQYSSGIQKLFLDNYQLEIIAASEDSKSHSENSSLREIILIAKRDKDEKQRNINFMKLSKVNHGVNWKTSSTQMVPKEILAREWNWTIFLRNPQLLEIRKIFLQSGYIKSGNDLQLEIVRGVEMYGPEFFFIPNKKWKLIADQEEKIVIESADSILEIPRKFIVRALRKPGNYHQDISPIVADFALSIPEFTDVSQEWVREYLHSSEQFAVPAKRKFGLNWYSHIHHQLNIKKPWGHLFFVDKFSVSSTSVMAHFSEDKLTCSKNFYVLRKKTLDQAKLLAAWLNSTFFVILFLLCRREIGGSYGRLQIIDYMKEPVFLDFSVFSDSVKNQILHEFDKLRKLKLPPIPEQLKLSQRKALDMAIIRGLNFPMETEKKLLDEIYDLVEKSLEELKRRDQNQ
ncbi:MAG: N-6 DNA methylase, partial [Candidatus Heimdallarchaeota archaeon]